MSLTDHFQLEPVSGPPIHWGANEFPDGQIQFWIEQEDSNRVDSLTCSLPTPTQLDLLHQMTSLVRNLSRARITYLYGARSDKDRAGTRSVANVANLTLAQLPNIAPHLELVSPHCEQLCHFDTNGPILNSFRIMKPIHEEILTNRNQYDAWLFPDESAHKRFGHLAPSEVRSLICQKERDQVSGEILNHGIPPLDGGTRVLVIDDLCDGGRTFIDVAKAMGTLDRLDLYVTHGVFSNNAPNRLYNAGFHNIYVTNSLPHVQEAHPSLHVLDIWNYRV